MKQKQPKRPNSWYSAELCDWRRVKGSRLYKLREKLWRLFPENLVDENMTVNPSDLACLVVIAERIAYLKEIGASLDGILLGHISPLVRAPLRKQVRHGR